MAKKVYLSLGSNVGDRERMLETALAALHARDLRLLRISPVYETEPVGFEGQRWFLNLVAEAETDLFPLGLLGRIARVEQRLGRRRTLVNGPRTIDIDILFYSGFVIQKPELTVPHPRFAERRFVLAPLADLAPDLRDPVSHRSVRELLATAPEQGVRRVEFTPRPPGII